MATGNRDSETGQVPAFRRLGLQRGVRMVSRLDHVRCEVNPGQTRVRGVIFLQLRVQPLHTHSKTLVIRPVRHLHVKQSADRILGNPQVPTVHGVHGYEVQFEARAFKQTTGLLPPIDTVLDIPIGAKHIPPTPRTFGSAIMVPAL